ncbi:hypothetical protein KW801_02110 [Candidatus Saccharibacteria bacterium]|nr:hypothetical protein [Candidatus Saccharibacteria bacterium]
METKERSLEATRPKLASELYDHSSLEQMAWSLIESRQGLEHDHWQQEPEINARTAIFEELTAKGHLSRIEFDETPDVINGRTLQRLINGWSDSLPPWEKERRFLEIVEELISHRVWQDIKTGRLPEDAFVITISNFPDNAPAIEASQVGYGILNKKGMVRTTSFENDTRTVEQVSRSNSDDFSAMRFFSGNGLVLRKVSSPGFLSSQIIASKADFPDGVVDIQRALDSFAGPNIIYGEDKSQIDLTVPDYDNLREVSWAREDQVESSIKKLADFERQLDIDYKQGLMSYNDKLSAINARRKELVNEICLLDPTYAKDARGEATVEHFEQAALAMAAGNDAAGIAHLESALSVADSRAGAVCGGNGLTTVVDNNQPTEAKRLFLEAKNERKNWKWKKGVCLVKECPTRPAKIKVGPCSVCEKCQGLYDDGKDPKSVYNISGFLGWLFGFDKINT